MFISEVTFYSQRPLVQFILGGVFERFPNLKFVITETGCDWVPPLLQQLDAQLDGIRRTGRTGELALRRPSTVPPLSATEYFARNCWMGVSQPGLVGHRGASTTSAPTGSCGAATTRTTRAPDRSRASTCARSCRAFPRTRSGSILAGNAAALYDFDLAALAPLAEQFGPTVEEIAAPLTELPEGANEALLRVASGSR